MAQTQLYAKKQDATSEYVNLELFDSEPIKLTLNVTSIEDPLAATSSYSKTFRVPHTSVNGPFFEGVFNVNSVDFDAAKKADAYILDNGMLLSNGQITLNGIYVNESTKNIEYEITFLGETSDFGAKIGGGFLSDLNLSKYNHSRNFQTITNSWSNGLFNGDITYGLIEWGYTYNANNQPVQPTLSNGFQKSFTDSANPLRIQQWKPQIRAKALWDAIFEEAGYTYDSTFLNSALFKKLYVISDNVAGAELGVLNTFEADRNSASNTTVGTAHPINANIEVEDPGNNYNPNDSTYIAPATGTYQFKITTEAWLDDRNGAASAGGTFRIINTANGQVLGSAGYLLTDGNTPVISTASVYLQQGDIVRFDLLTGNITNTIPGVTRIEYYSMDLKCTDAPTIMTIASMMPNNIRKIDYMRSIINRFRLVFVPSRNIANHFTITPWKDWILEGKTVDWSNKLDTSKDVKITPLFYGQSRFQIYKDQEDADYVNYNYQLTYKQTIGQLNLDSTNELIKGTKEYKDQFAPTPIAPIGFKEGDLAGSRFLIPHIAKDSGSTDDTTGTNVITGKREPIQPKLRLVFYNGIIPAPLTWYMATSITGTGSQAQTTYPLMSQYSAWPVTQTTFDLSWENENPSWDFNDIVLGNGKTPFSSFNVYWKTWYDLVFDPYSRMVEVNLILDYNDVLDIKFNDYVFIKDAWYFVNKISDFIVGQNTNCRVELIKLGNNIGLTIPIVTPSQNTPIILCTAATACRAFCCSANVINSEPAEYYLNGGTPQTSNVLYQDQQGTIFAPEGIYSDGTSTFQVNANGLISSFYDTSGCVCTQPSFDWEVKFSNTLCTACCAGSNIVVYGNNETFLSSGYLYLTADFTIPAAPGYYSLDGSVVEVGANGQIISIVSCDDCNCVTLFPYEPCYSPELCDACCCPGTLPVWTESAVWDASSVIYADNAGVNTAPAGFYIVGSQVLEVVEGGTVVGTASCEGCGPCTEGPVEVTVTVSKDPGGRTLTGSLQFSYDNQNWINVGSVSIVPTDPINTARSSTFYVADDVFTRTIFTTDYPFGDLSTSYRIDAQTFQDFTAATPVSRTTVIPGQVNQFSTYEYIGIVTAAEPCEPSLLVGGFFNDYKSTGWPGGGAIRSIIALKADGSVDTDFDVVGGLKIGLGNGFIWDIKKWGDKFVIGGEFDNYNGVDVTNGLIVLNADGSIYEPFQTLVGAYAPGSPDFPNGRWIEVAGDIVYIGGEFLYWNKAPLGSTTPDYYTASPRMVAINLTNGSINTGFNAAFDTAPIDTQIEVIKVVDSKIYVGGFMLSYGADTRRWLYRLNLDGTLDTTFNATDIGGIVYDIEFDGDYIWIATQGPGRFQKILKSNGSQVSWGPATKFNEQLSAINIVGDNIYAVGSFTSYNGTSINRIASINKNTGVLNSSFAVPTGLDSQARNAITDGEFLYVTGDFTQYNGATVNRILKVALADGVRDPEFNTGTGFGGITLGLLKDVCPSLPIFPIDTIFGASACDAWCELGIPTLVYGNGLTLVQSTQLFLDAAGTIEAPAGFYSDGITIAQVGANGIIIGYINSSLCPCTVTELYRFDTVYDATAVCDALCDGVDSTIYLNSPNVNTASIAYADPQGNTFAAPGYYIYLTNVITVIGNGVISGVSQVPGNCNCLTEECAIYRIQNTSNSQISATWVDCYGLPVSPTNLIPSGGSILTSCTLPSSISATGSIVVSYNGPCTDPTTCTINIGTPECRITGSCNDNALCGVKFPVIFNCAAGSTVEMIINQSADSQTTLSYEGGEWVVNYTEFNAVTAFANITLNVVNGGQVIGTTTRNITHGSFWSFLPSCGPEPAIPCITMYYETQTYTYQCLFNEYNGTSSKLTVFLRDQDGNAVIASENIAVKIRIEENDQYGGTNVTFETVTVLSGTDRTVYNGNFYSNYADDGQGNCTYQYREYAGIDLIVPGNYAECPPSNPNPACRYYTVSTPGPMVTFEYMSCAGNNVLTGSVGGFGGFAVTSFCAIVNPGPEILSGPGTIQGGTMQCGLPEPLPTTQHCYAGIWEVDDPAHPNGGSITYIDGNGAQQTINMIWLDQTVTIYASSIVSKTGIAIVEC